MIEYNPNVLVFKIILFTQVAINNSLYFRISGYFSNLTEYQKEYCISVKF